MLTEKRELIIEDKSYFVNVDIMEESDKHSLIEIYNLWNQLSEMLSDYGCRRINFPELSELIFVHYTIVGELIIHRV